MRMQNYCLVLEIRRPGDCTSGMLCGRHVVTPVQLTHGVDGDRPAVSLGYQHIRRLFWVNDLNRARHCARCITCLSSTSAESVEWQTLSPRRAFYHGEYACAFSHQIIVEMGGLIDVCWCSYRSGTPGTSIFF